MRRAAVYIIVILFIPGALSAQTFLNFDDYFVDKTMRLDYFSKSRFRDKVDSFDTRLNINEE